MNIYLIGYMYSGKTTIGRQLAQRLGMDFTDLDQLFEEHYHITLPIFFKKYGEKPFRTLERQLLHSTENLRHTVISTGGGTPCYFDNMDFIRANGTSVYLRMPYDAICARMTVSKKQRPVFNGLSDEERRNMVREQLEQRQQYYTQADITFDAFNPDLDALESCCRQALSSTPQTPPTGNATVVDKQ
ncbi:MAG: shikimate kinase [Bacteroidales bacterium]|nr:shikimate kinase [Bacteroidales bacterium]